MNSQHRSPGCDGCAIDQLVVVVPAHAANNPERYRTFAAYSNYCLDHYVSALPMSQCLARDYFADSVLRPEISPWMARIVLSHLKAVYHDMRPILSSHSCKWDDTIFARLLARHATEWEHSETSRILRMKADDQETLDPLHVPDNVATQDSDTSWRSIMLGHHTRPRNAHLSSYPGFIGKAGLTESTTTHGVKRSRSIINHTVKRARLDSPASCSPLLASENALCFEQRTHRSQLEDSRSYHSSGLISPTPFLLRVNLGLFSGVRTMSAAYQESEQDVSLPPDLPSLTLRMASPDIVTASLPPLCIREDCESLAQSCESHCASDSQSSSDIEYEYLHILQRSGDRYYISANSPTATTPPAESEVELTVEPS